jgi:hypothetical protein
MVTPESVSRSIAGVKSASILGIDILHATAGWGMNRYAWDGGVSRPRTLPYKLRQIS